MVHARRLVGRMAIAFLPVRVLALRDASVVLCVLLLCNLKTAGSICGTNMRHEYAAAYAARTRARPQLLTINCV